MNQICNTCSIEKDENNYLKDRTVCKKRYNKNRRKNNINTIIQNQQPKTDEVNNKNTIVSTYEDHANVITGPRNNGKTYYILKKLEKVSNKRSILIIPRSPNQYPIYKTSNEIKPLNKYKGSVVISDDMLGARNSSQIDEFFTGGSHEDIVKAFLFYRDKALEITVID